MKKILSLLLVITMIIAICPIPTKAATTGTLYCDFTEITTDAGLSAGTEYMFLTTHYTSSDAVTTIGAGNAKLRVTDTANSGGTKLTGDGYTMGRYVEVVTAGTGFDGCPNGAITYTKGAWYYWCSGGGVHHVGPFYAFSYTQKSFSASDINVTVNYNTLNTTDTVDKSDLNIQVAGYNVSDYTITDGSISPSDRQITLNVGGVSFTATLGKVVTFTSDANSTGTTTTKVVLPDSKGISVPSSDGTYSGHTFQGWAATSGSSVVSYAPGAIYNIDESATFYAVWKADTYDIAYDANGGSSAPESQTKTYNVGLALSSTVPVRDGYTFINWNAVKGGGGTSYASGATYTANSALTLYAQWTAETYSVSYNANGGSGAPAAQTKTYGSELTLSGTTPTCSGYIFVGWSKDASAKSADYSAGGSYTANEGVTLYAVWQSAADTVSYNANGGSDAPAAQTKIPNVDLTLSSTVPTRTGYTFLGWATSPNGPVAYSAGGLYPAEDSVVFYAVWLANTYEVKYDDNLPGGKATTVPDSQAKTHDVSLTLSGVVPTFEGYTFTGWATASNGAVAYAPGSVYTGNAGVTLYAVWADSKYNTSTVLTTVPSANVFDGDSVTLTATVSRVGQGTVHPSDGTVTFFEGSTVLGTTLVGTDGAATFNITAVVGSHTYSAVYNGNDEAYRSTNGDNACTLSVKSIVVILGYSELAVSPDIDLNGDVLAVGTTYVLTAPTVFASDDKDKTTALSVNTHYTVQWYWYNGSSWCEVNSDTGNPTRLTVTPSANGQKWYAKILPAGKYQQPSSGLSTVQVTCGTLINTATTLASTPTSAYENAANAVTLTATVKYGTSSPVNDGWVMFMNENDVQVGYAKLDNQGHASVTVTLPAYSSGDHIANYYAVYEGTSAYDISKSKSPQRRSMLNQPPLQCLL